MPIARTSIIKGPALVQFRSSNFFSKGDIQLTTSLDTFNVESAAHGKLDERVTSRRVEVSFEPVGEWEALGVLWPYGAFEIGKSIFDAASYGGSGENTLVIHTVAGVKITVPAAAVTRMPDIELSAQRTLIGGVTFTGLNKDNTAWSAADSLIKIESTAFPSGAGVGLGAIDLSKIRTVPYSAAWGSDPWDAIKTISGWRIGFDMATRPIETDDDGMVDMVFENLGVTARAQPVGITEAELVTALAVQNSASVIRGASMQTLGGGNNLVIQGAASGDPKVTLTKCAVKQSGLAFGPATPRIGELQWIATRSFTNGVPNALFTVESVA